MKSWIINFNFYLLYNFLIYKINETLISILLVLQKLSLFIGISLKNENDVLFFNLCDGGIILEKS